MSDEIGAKELALYKRLRADFAFYAPRALKIRGKDGGFIPFTLSSAQVMLHQAIEQQRAEKGRVRIVCLKGRQQGISTYTQGRFFWRLTHGQGLRAFILTHLDQTTDSLYGMVNTFYDRCPPELKPEKGTANAKEFAFSKLGSGYKVATAGNKGAGVGETLQLFHGSEVSRWPNAEDHISGALQAVPNAPGTEVILESTSEGPEGLFYKLCVAAKMGDSQYKLVFIPWFMQAEYVERVDPEFTMNGEEQATAEEFGLSREQIAWRRMKILDMGTHKFRRSYPATFDEAWQVDATGAIWRREWLEAPGFRVASLPEMRRLVVAVDPSGGAAKRNDECGIVVAGLGVDGRGYVLEDATGKFSPSEWAHRVVSLYHRYEADLIVAEKNFGGDLVLANIRTADAKVPVKMVTASRGKQQRAEPVAALYEQNQISHYGMLSALEDELVTHVPGVSKKSPNRLDGVVWAISELMLQDTGTYDRSLRWVSEGAAALGPMNYGMFGLI